MGEADFSGLRHMAPADQTGIGYGMMRGAELPLNDERAVIEHCGDAEYLGGSSASSKLNGGSIPETRWASIVLPDPGGPIMRTLCNPAAATSMPRFACSCPSKQ